MNAACPAVGVCTADKRQLAIEELRVELNPGTTCWGGSHSAAGSEAGDAGVRSCK